MARVLHGLRDLLVNAYDVVRAAPNYTDIPALRVEYMATHRISSRRFVLRLLKKGGVGAELGVFTGLLSMIILKEARPKKVFFVDPWHLEYGETYPDWGRYTD